VVHSLTGTNEDHEIAGFNPKKAQKKNHRTTLPAMAAWLRRWLSICFLGPCEWWQAAHGAYGFTGKGALGVK
jgi:hypothetical protein